MKSTGPFGVQVVLTADGKAFRDTWNAATSPPQLPSTKTVRRGDSLSAMVVFHGCAPGPAGKCDAEVAFTIEQPDGKRVAGPSGPLWTGAPATGRLLLADAHVTVSFDPQDAAGTYRIRAKVTDKVSARQIEVSAPFTLQ